MKKLKSKILAFLLFAGLLLAAEGISENDSVLAAVNGDPITLGEILPHVRDRELQLRSVYLGKVLEEKILQLRRQVVEEIIDSKLIVADFNSKNFNIPPQEVENELDRWGTYIGCHSRRELEERVKKSGTSIRQLKEKIRNRMIVQVMRRREFLLAGPPSPADIFKRFKKEEKNLAFPGNTELALLKLPLADKSISQKIAEDLKKAPENWSLWAARHAITPGTNGNIGTIDLDKLRPEFAKSMKKITVRKIYGPITANDGIYFIKVLKYAPPRAAKFKDHAEALKKKIEDEIYRNSSAEYAARLRDAAVIEYFFPAPQGVKKK